ncbi:FACT complex subunit SPT16 [Coprinopsis cinerea okayama7|uniref:FACT complex subunit n=1 Tax=Coprinopsis cinerea (strain Okayama-7 / 130 / ATCC MYA-4618 / FGSC 9003) TaxID=240176 RepID=A8NG21_COPC7|nr:FACT complex subunit SPT16 [Coprinopsis cinerea okayama7\|eukprot:XP_001833455.2 FACT complex subunit SPT16 [Coprinopsis cinerea okayama7\
MPVELNKATFAARVKKVYEGWNSASQNEEYSSIADVDGLFLLAGDPASEDEPTRKGTCFQQWLLGYEFPSTFFFFQKDKISVLCSTSKAKILSQIEKLPGIPPLDIHAQAKAKEPPNDAVPRFFQKYQSAKRVGALLKENHTGKLVTEWQKLVAEADTKPESVEMGPAVSAFMAVKDEEELKLVQIAANLTSTLLKHHVAPKLESILDKESRISHDMLSAQIETRLGSGEGDNAKGPDMKVWSKGKNLENIDWQSAEFCYPPIIISKSSSTGYDLRYTIESTEDNIAHKGVLLTSFGLRYKTYSTNVGRTFIVDPNPDQESQYNLLLSLQTELLSFIKDGVQAKEVYAHAVNYVRERKPELEKNFVKTVGFGIGMEFRDATYVLSGKNSRVIKKDMTFNLGLGFSDLTEPNGQKYALQLVDTIRVDTNKSVLLTDGIKSSKETLFFLDSESDEEKPKKKAPAPKANGAAAKVKTVGGKVLRNQRRVQDEVHQTAAARLIEHQRELHEKLQESNLERFSEGGGKTSGKEGKSWKKFQSYKGEGALPQETEKLRIYVDRKAQSVILPIHGFAVPFHINTIKNASKNDEGEFTYLRINFQTPGQLAGKKEDTPFEDPDATFIRSVSYRSPDGHRFDNLVKQITELKKEANKREQQKKEMADVIEQGNLIEIKGRRPYKLSEAFIRPALDGKRLPGEVEIHQNGIRYQSVGAQKVDVLFSNVKHLFFQPCDHELLVIVHLHLKAPIIIGKKKTFDVQFFREATDVQFDETGNRKRKHRYGDEDEIEMEQQERKRRAILNKEVKAFAERIAEAASHSLGETLEVDVPFRELSFEGVPFRTSVRLQPTTECLVHLTDPPFLVVTLTDIEIASLERVQYGLKQFDLILVFKDFTKPPLHINSIQSSQMDDVKNWLDSVDIPMAEGPVNLNWGPIMKHINDNPYEFFQEGGGWSFLGVPGAESAESESEDSESEFEADSDDFQSESSSDDESDFSDASGSDDSGSEDYDDASDSGESWDELERKAAKADMKRSENRNKGSDDSDDDRPKKKKATNGKVKGKR